MKTYKEWIVDKYFGKYSMRGDLAYDIKRDETFPNELTNCERITNHLKLRNACKECVALFKRTWKDYCKETGYTE